MVSITDPVLPADVADEMALAEYKQIKAEQVARINTRDNLIYVTLVAIAGGLAVPHAAHSRGYLLLVPAAAFVLGWTYLANDNMITAIGRYVREHPVLAMGWEHDHAADTRRASRKAIQLAVDLATFCGSAVVALATFWLALPQPPALVAASIAEALATGVLAWQFAAYSEQSRNAQRKGAQPWGFPESITPAATRTTPGSGWSPAGRAGAGKRSS